MSSAFDAVVIGSGQAGPFLGARLAAAGMKVALIEREHLGGTCVNDGCMPTKTLVASARAAIFEPSRAITSAGGPMNVMCWLAHAVAKRGFSERKPYPG